MNFSGCGGAPTWRLCHPVNIYVYKNGVVAEKPQLVHIPMEKKKNMTTVLEAIQDRMKLPAAYPIALYNMDGTRVCKTYELEMYNNYVVVTNLDKRFKCVCYGQVRDPLVVIGSHSKHVNTLKFQNKKYDLFCRQKMARTKLHELMGHGEADGLGPCELPALGKPCGALCHKIMPTTNRPTQYCSDEIMVVDGAAMDQEEDRCRQKCQAPPQTSFQDEELNDLCKKVRCSGGGNQAESNLMDLIQRYKDVGSDIFKMFQDRIHKDIQQEEDLRTKWKLETGSNMSVETQQKLKEELMKMANQNCQFAFDQYGNYVPSEGCRISGEEQRGDEVRQEERKSRFEPLKDPDAENKNQGQSRMSAGGSQLERKQSENQMDKRQSTMSGGGNMVDKRQSGGGNQADRKQSTMSGGGNQADRKQSTMSGGGNQSERKQSTKSGGGTRTSVMAETIEEEEEYEVGMVEVEMDKVNNLSDERILDVIEEMMRKQAAPIMTEVPSKDLNHNLSQRSKTSTEGNKRKHMSPRMTEAPSEDLNHNLTQRGRTEGSRPLESSLFHPENRKGSRISRGRDDRRRDRYESRSPSSSLSPPPSLTVGQRLHLRQIPEWDEPPYARRFK